MLIKPGTLVILSGPSASGKSTCAPEEMTISSDRLRKQFFGLDYIPNGQRPRPTDDRFIFEAMEQIVSTRLRVGMTTFVDATLLRDKDRKRFVDVAEQFNREYIICIFDVPVETLIVRDRNRNFCVGEDFIYRQLNKFRKDSIYPHYIADKFEFDIDPWHIVSDIKIDAIGDIHGCYNELLGLLDQLGYDETLTHPEDRRLLFMGDYCDRGTQSIEVLNLVRYAVEIGHYALLGNHDANLLKGLEGQEVRSQSTNETLHKILSSYNENQKNELIEFLKSLPPYYLYGSMLCCHADVSYWSADKPLKDFIYGESTLSNPQDTDEKWRQIETTELLRGHIPLTSPGEQVYSVDNFAGLGGTIKAMRLPEFQEYFSETTLNYEDRRKDNLAAKFEPLVSKKLIKKNINGSLSLYKYSRKAFYDPKCWDQYPILKQARGVVIGLDGNPVSTVFPRTFNYLEQDTGKNLDRDSKVVIADKLNGFLCTTFIHPYSDEMVITTSGSFDGPYYDMAKELFFKTKTYGPVYNFLKTHCDVTLLWEVIHPEDEHPIPYDESMYGVHLIGVGQDGYIYSEPNRYSIAESLNVPTPRYMFTTFGEAIDLNLRTTGEGYMVRDLEGNYLMKLKSPVYLTTKFLQRLTEGKSQFMYSNPEQFKRSLDEELYPIVDVITETIPLDEWLNLDEIYRRDFVRNEILNMVS